MKLKNKIKITNQYQYPLKGLLFPPNSYLHFHFISFPLLKKLSTLSLLFSSMASDTSSTDTGFTRPEMYTEKLAGTVDTYDRHVFLYYKNPLSWPPRVEASDDHPLPKLVADTFKARKNDLALKVRSSLSFCQFRLTLKLILFDLNFVDENHCV